MSAQRFASAFTVDAPEQIVGMIGIGKPIAAFSPFIANAREKLVFVGVTAVVAFAVLLLMVTVWLVRPFGLVTDLWRALRARPGEGRSFNQSLRAAFLDMRDALAGKSYVDEYVAALTHEIKSPLAAIRGAAELLREPLPEDARLRFTGNVEEQVRRAQDLVDRMLELSGLERRRPARQPRSRPRAPVQRRGWRRAARVVRLLARRLLRPCGLGRPVPAATGAGQFRAECDRILAA
jgi:two-component system sensor histidine kinase CreC